MDHVGYQECDSGCVLGLSTPRRLPWEWFEFSGGLRQVGPGIELSVGHGGGPQAWAVKGVPFKMLRRAPVGNRARPWVMMMHGMGLGIGTFRGVAPYLLETHDL